MSFTAVHPRVAVVGGGIAGTLCSLVLKRRGLHPVLIDAGRHGAGGRLRNGGAQFLRATDPRLIPVVQMLHQEGLLKEWKGRFGMLGSSGGGFLPAEIVAHNRSGGSGGGSILELQKQDRDDMLSGKPTVTAATDAGDFCQFVEGSSLPTYVGDPSMSELCPQILGISGIEQINNSTLVAATPRQEGGWSLLLENENEPHVYDALVLATHDPSLASGALRSIANAEAHAGGYQSVEDATKSSKDDASLVIQRLIDVSKSLQRVRDEDKLPVYSISLTYPNDFSNALPFDAVSIPGSQHVQYLAREASKSADNTYETWSAITTSQFASTVLDLDELNDDEKKDVVLAAVTTEMRHLFSKYFDDETLVPTPLTSHVKRWGAAFCGKGLELKEDSIILAPWRLCICGDYIRDLSVHSSPLEAAALSGLEAGERISSLWIHR